MGYRPSRPAKGNRLLAALPAEELDRLERRAEERDLTPRQNLLTAGTRIEHVYFLLQGMVSLVQPLRDGAVVELALVGREGFVGMPVLLGGRTSSVEAIVQAPGRALRLRATVLREEVEHSPALFAVLQRHVLALHRQVSQAAACYGRHTVQERLARWLLSARDRIESDELPLSHEFLAEMLGMRRASVTVAIGALRTAGLIRNTPGRITILDADKLETASCECYRAVREEYERLVG
jgi:CRP-like cAMP-binding protein